MLKNKTKKEKIYLLLIALLAAAIIVVLIVGLSGHKPEAQVETAPEKPDTVEVKEVTRFFPVEKKITAEIIRDGLNDMGVLLTEEYYFTEVVSFSSVKKFLNTDIVLGFTESYYLASYDGNVAAGIDFTKITVEKDEESACITVHIPKAEIISVDVDPSSFVLYSEKVGFTNPLSVADFNNSLIELERNAGSKATEKGILIRANENARAIVENFIGSLVDTAEYTISFVTD